MERNRSDTTQMLSGSCKRSAAVCDGLKICFSAFDYNRARVWSELVERYQLTEFKACASTAQSAAAGCLRMRSGRLNWSSPETVFAPVFPNALRLANLRLLDKSTCTLLCASFCRFVSSSLQCWSAKKEIYWIRLTRLIIKEIGKESLFLSRRGCFFKKDKKPIATVVGGAQSLFCARNAGFSDMEMRCRDAVSYNMTETSKWCFGEKMIAAIQLADCSEPGRRIDMLLMAFSILYARN